MKSSLDLRFSGELNRLNGLTPMCEHKWWSLTHSDLNKNILLKLILPTLQSVWATKTQHLKWHKHALGRCESWCAWCNWCTPPGFVALLMQNIRFKRGNLNPVWENGKVFVVDPHAGGRDADFSLQNPPELNCQPRVSESEFQFR